MQKKFGGPRGSRGGGGSRGFRRDDRPREEHEAICAECKKKCTVPFKPTQDRPVYCRDCYKKKKGFD